MKRLYIAALLFAVAVALCITSTVVTSRVEKEVGEPLEKTIDFFEKGPHKDQHLLTYHL